MPIVMTRTPELVMGPFHLLEASSQTYMEWMEPSMPIESPIKNLPVKSPPTVARVARTNHPMAPGKQILGLGKSATLT